MSYRTGDKLGRTVYLDNKLIGLMDTREFAAEAVAALNAVGSIREIRRDSRVEYDLRQDLNQSREAYKHVVGANIHCHQEIVKAREHILKLETHITSLRKQLLRFVEDETEETPT